MSDVAGSPAVNHPHAASVVPDARRMQFLPDLFGVSRMLTGESMVYSFTRHACAAYSGGLWEFLELDGKPLYMRQAQQRLTRFAYPGNGFESTVTTDAAGIIACLMTFSHLSFDDRTDHMAEAFHRLREFALDHPEVSEIFRAID
ncbi:antirestriction protein [Aureimonas sp. SK2]|uniref:antirestriction protein n=1 Tax=Aureimonas sp. SK2 TaxID=3015992 RepID=UPI002444E604|nr:antirestriction protein [Aureimonas sp. SK2]